MPTTRYATLGVSRPQPPVVPTSCCCRPCSFFPLTKMAFELVCWGWGLVQPRSLYPSAGVGSPPLVLRSRCSGTKA